MSDDGRTLVACGPSAFTDTAKIERALLWAVQHRGVVRIACTGSMEKHVAPFAAEHGVECKVYRAEYRRYGPPGSIVRNVNMLEDANADIVVGFTDTLDDNTVDVLRRAMKQGIPTYLVSTTIVTPRAVA
jgi:hypothetical protein